MNLDFPIRERAARGARALLLAAAACCFGGASGVSGSAPENLPHGDDPVAFARDPIDVVDDRHGLPQSSVSSLVLDLDGRLWAGTQDGLARFDGRKWEVVDLPDRALSNWVRALAVDGSGALWVGSSHGVHRLDRDGRWRSYHQDDGLPADMVRSLLVTREGDEEVIYAGSVGGIARFAGGAWQPIVEEALFGTGPVRSLLASAPDAPEQVLWASTATQGIAVRRAGRWSRLGEADGLLPGGVRTMALERLPNGTDALWVGFIQSPGVVRLRPDGVDRFAAGVGGFPNAFALDIAAVRYSGRSEVWAGTAGSGIARFDGRSWQVLDRRGGLPDQTFWRILPWPTVERPRSFFLGSDGAGLVRLDLGAWRPVVDPEGLLRSSAYTFAESGAASQVDRFVVGTTERGAIELRDGVWRSLGPAEIGNDSVGAFATTRAPDGDEQLWIGSSTQGLWLGDRRGWRREPVPFGPILPAVRDLYVEAGAPGSSTLWMATRAGLFRRDPIGVWERVVPSLDGEAPAPEAFFSIAETFDRQGRRTLWFGTDGKGLLALRDGAWRSYGAADGLPNPIVVDLLVEPLAQGESRLWFATGGGGAGWLDPGAERPQIAVLDDRSTPALPNNSLYALARDVAGRIYFSTNRGVARWTAGNGPDPRTGTIRVFTTGDGLPSNEGNQRGAYVDRRGRVWFATVRGIAVFDPALEVDERTPRSLRFAGVRVNGVSRPTLNGAVLRHDESSIAIEFALASLARSEATTYRTQLVGLDAEPLAWSPATRRELTTLPAGSYRFRVWARDAWGTEAGPIELAFRVKPAPWLSGPAFLVYALGAGAALWGVHRLRLRLIERRFAVVVAERNRMARELHDTVMQSLAGISFQLDDADWKLAERPDEVRDALTRSRSLIESAHSEVRRSVWGLRAGALEEQDLPSALAAQAQQLAHGTGVEIRSSVEGDVRRLAPAVELELLRIGQEATTNALKYAGARTIELRVRFVPERVTVEVRDDGRGFSVDSAGAAGGFGLAGMRERAASIGAELTIRSRPGAGSTVSVDMPAPNAPAAGGAA